MVFDHVANTIRVYDMAAVSDDNSRLCLNTRSNFRRDRQKTGFLEDRARAAHHMVVNLADFFSPAACACLRRIVFHDRHRLSLCQAFV